jgi:hypothetical protein
MKKQKNHGPPRSQAIAAIHRKLVELLAGSERYADLWLETPNPHLSGRIPEEMIEAGELRPVELLVNAMEARVHT